MKFYRLILAAVLLLSFTAYFFQSEGSDEASEVISIISQRVSGSDTVEVHTQDDISWGVTDQGNYILRSDSFAPDVIGYGGPFILGLRLTSQGNLLDLEILRHYETPRWIQKILPWKEELTGINIFNENEIRSVDTVTGATYTTAAIREILWKTGKGFQTVLNNEAPAVSKESFSFIPEFPFLLMVLFTIGALFIRRSPKKAVRISFMVLVFIVTALVYQIQYSTFQIHSMLSFKAGINGLSLALYFTLLLPPAIVIFGNFYCGYLCPFGILQEITGELSGFIQKKIFKGKSLPYYPVITNKVKYFILLLILTLTFMGSQSSLIRLDLGQFFFFPENTLWSWLTLLFLLLSLANKRMWCRYFCPTGAFLSLLNGLSFTLYKKTKWSFLKKNRPIPRINKCDLQVPSLKHVDCLSCDRCRYSCSSKKEKSIKVKRKIS